MNDETKKTNFDKYVTDLRLAVDEAIKLYGLNKDEAEIINHRFKDVSTQMVDYANNADRELVKTGLTALHVAANFLSISYDFANHKESEKYKESAKAKTKTKTKTKTKSKTKAKAKAKAKSKSKKVGRPKKGSNQ